MADRVCSIEGCERKHSARGYCASHYQRERLNDPTRPRCGVTDCVKTEYARGLCRGHYCDEHLAGYWQDPSVKARHLEASQRWYAANRDQELARIKAWKQANSELVTRHRRDWRKANPERYRELGKKSDALRRAREAAVQTDPVDLTMVLAEHGLWCHICSDPIEPSDLHFDHVIPLCKGGPHTYENIRPAHSWCNLRKGTKLLDSTRR